MVMFQSTTSRLDENGQKSAFPACDMQIKQDRLVILNGSCLQINQLITALSVTCIIQPFQTLPDLTVCYADSILSLDAMSVYFALASCKHVHSVHATHVVTQHYLCNIVNCVRVPYLHTCAEVREDLPLQLKKLNKLQLSIQLQLVTVEALKSELKFKM